MMDVVAHKMIRKAIKQGAFDEVERLIGSDKSLLEMMTPFGTWLHIAASHGKLDIVRWLIAQGANVNAAGGSFEGTPVHMAASKGHLEVVKYLIESDAILDVSEPVRNPLFGAIYGGYTAVAKLLMDSGIDTSVSYTGENMTNMDAVAFAREWGRSDIIELLKMNDRL